MYTVHLDNLGMVFEFQFDTATSWREQKQKAVGSVVIRFWGQETKKGIDRKWLIPLLYIWW